LLVAALDIALVVAGAIVALLARVLFGRPWELEATSDRGERYGVRVRGWRASQDRVAQVVELLGAGLPIPGSTWHSVPDEHGIGNSDIPGGRVDEDISPRGPPAEVGAPRPARSARATTWASLAALVISLTLLAALYLGPWWFWRTDCPAPGVATREVTEAVMPAVLVASGPLSLDDAVGGKYGSDARRSALDTGALIAARHEDWQTDEDITLLRLLTFETQQQALESGPTCEPR
jgi:hypothetical protein